MAGSSYTLGSVSDATATTKGILKVGATGSSLKGTADVPTVNYADILGTPPGGGGTTAAWGGITGTLSNQTDLASALAAKANTSSLAPVATTGAYNDLTGKPTLFSGAYNDLTGKPNLAAKEDYLTPTATKTADYTALVGDFVMVDATSGPVTITLPVAAANQRIAVKKIDSTANPVNVVRSGTDFIGSQSATSLPIATQNESATYFGSTGRWNIENGHLSRPALDLRYLLQTGGTLTGPLNITGTSGTLGFSASSDGGDYNIFTTGGTRTLALYGAGANTLNVNLLDGALTVSAGLTTLNGGLTVQNGSNASPYIKTDFTNGRVGIFTDAPSRQMHINATSMLIGATPTSNSAFVFDNEFFGMYSAGNARYYGFQVGLPASTGRSVIGGYYAGLGIGGGTHSGQPIFGVLNDIQGGNGIGNTAFTVIDNNQVYTFNTTLDDGAGNLIMKTSTALTIGTTDDVFYDAFRLRRNNIVVGQIDNNASNIRIKASTATAKIQLHNNSGVGVELAADGSWTFGTPGITDATNVVLGTTTGTKIGTAATQKLGFYGATAIVQPVAATDLGTVLSSLGLRVAGTAYPITTSGAVAISGTFASTGSVRSNLATTLTAATTLTTASVEYQPCNATTAAFNVTPPATTTPGYRFCIIKVDASANAVTVVGTINGVTNYVLSTQWKRVTLVTTSTSGTFYIVDNN